MRRLLEGKSRVLGELAHGLVADRIDHALHESEEPLHHAVSECITHRMHGQSKIANGVDGTDLVQLGEPVDQAMHGLARVRIIEPIEQFQAVAAHHRQAFDHAIGQRLAGGKTEPRHFVHRRLVGHIVHYRLPFTASRARTASTAGYRPA